VNFIAKYGKSFASKEEIPKRFAIFSERYIMIKEHNSRPGVLTKLAINQFADMSHEELVKGLIIDEKDFSSVQSIKLESKNLEQSTSKDWRSLGKVGPVLNQGTCGASHAFSGADVL
jgi:C1A family cysteine protease